MAKRRAKQFCEQNLPSQCSCDEEKDDKKLYRRHSDYADESTVERKAYIYNQDSWLRLNLQPAQRCKRWDVFAETIFSAVW